MKAMYCLICEGCGLIGLRNDGANETKAVYKIDEKIVKEKYSTNRKNTF